MATSSISATQSSVPIVDKNQTGFGALNSDTFLKLLIAQLQNQDPLEPMGNDELLSQLSMMRNLQSNVEMTNALKSITVNQQLSTAATFIGKAVNGTADDNSQVTGIVDRAFLVDDKAYVGVGNAEIQMSKVNAVGLAE